VAVATASGHAWASHRTAAALHGLDGFDRGPVEVLAPHGRGRARAGWTVHESRHLRAVDLGQRDGVPCTTVVRTVLDLPAVAHPFRAGQALDHACRLEPGALDLIVRRFVELARRGRPGTALMRALLAERLATDRFTQSGFEAVTLRLVRSVGLPEPVTQHLVRDGSFRVHLDLAWPPIRLGLECDSLAFHSGKRAHEWDRQRRRHLARLGWEIVEVTYDDVTKRPRRTGAELRELHALRTATIRAVSGVRPVGSSAAGRR
jgi:very-short-patch-repair endonuclease